MTTMVFYGPRCTCPTWTDADEFDGPQDHADACGSCPIHGTAVAS